MPSWKKVILSGSNAALNSLTVSNGITGSLFGTASWAQNALTSSYSLNPTVSGAISQVDYIDFNTGSAEPAWKSGRVYWNNTDGALSVYNAEADIALQVGQENWVRVFNEGGLIANGTAVRIVGSHGDVPLIIKAQSVQVSGSALGDNQIIGIATHDIETNSIGYVTTQGLTRGLNTNAFTDGDLLFVSSSAGVLTNVIPKAPYEVIQVGICVKAGPGGSGIVFVFPTQPIDFGDLASAERGVYQYGDLWSYQQTGSVGVWKHGRSLSGSYGITGSLDVSGGITGSLLGTSSLATNVVGTANRILFNNATNTTITSNNLTWTDSTNLLTLGDATGTAGTISKLALYTSSFGGYGLGVSPGQLDYVSDGSHVFYKNGSTPTELVRITNAGDVGINKVSPNAKLDVNGNVIITGSLTVTNGITGNASTATLVTGTSGQLQTKDDRIIEPNSITTGRLQFGFTSWNNNNGSPYADYLHLRSYSDGSGGNDNLVMFRKDAIGMRIWQQSYGSATAYSSYKDVAWTDGTNASGTWGISITGTAATASFVANAFIQGGNSFGTTALLGTNDEQSLALETSGSTRMFISSSGNVGIGTTTPGYKLHVVGDSFFQSSFSTYTADGLFSTDAKPGVWVRTPGGTAQGVRLGYRDFGGGQYSGRVGFVGSTNWSTGIANLAGTNFSIGLGNTVGTDYLTIVSGSGNVGIGITAPTTPLHVSGTIQVQTATGNTFYGQDSGGSYARTFGVELYDFRDAAGATKVRINTSTGYVGIGTTTPIEKLHIVSTSGSAATYPIAIQNATGSIDTKVGIKFIAAAATTRYAAIEGIQEDGNNSIALGFITGQGAAITEKMRIVPGGNVGIGTTTPFSRLTTLGALSTTTSQMSIVNSEGGHTILRTGIASISNSGFSLISADVNGSNQNTRLVVSSAGNVGIGTTTPNAKLDVNGNVIITGSLTVTQGITGSLFGTSSWAVSASYISPTATNAFIQGGNSFGTTALLGTNDEQSLALETSGSTRMFISSSGNIGIGTTSPGAKLNVNGSIYAGASDQIQITPTDNASLYYHAANGTTFTIGTKTYTNPLVFAINSVEKMRISSTGFVGIGTTLPSASLHVQGTVMISQSLFQYSSNAAILSGSTADIASFNTSSYMAGFFDFVASSGTNARAGTLFTVWNGTNVEYVETSTNDIGSTTNLILSASLLNGNVRLQGTSLSGSWNVKTLTRMI